MLRLLPLASLFASPLAAQTQAYAPDAILIEKPHLMAAGVRPVPPLGDLGPPADVDGDGDQDLFYGGGWLENDGSANFRARFRRIADEPRACVFDLEPDGDPDLLTQTHLYLADGNGNFTDASSRLPLGWSAALAQAADLDGDGDVDLFGVEPRSFPTASGFFVALNDGSGHFSASVVGVPTSSSALDARLGNIDGDGDVDVVVLDQGRVEIWLNGGSATFLAGPVLPDFWEELELVDVDDDDDLDLVVGDRDGTAVYLNDGVGAFAESVGAIPATTRTTVDLVIGDWNGDGHPDVLEPGKGQFQGCFDLRAAGRMLLNDGSGVFSVDSSWTSDLGNVAGWLLDLDGDGDTDYVADNLFPNRVYLQDDAGAVASQGDRSLAFTDLESYHDRRAAIGDVNGDGYVDVLCPPLVLFGTAQGTLEEGGASLPILPMQCIGSCGDRIISSVTLGDVDGDMDLDAVVTIPFVECGPPNINLWLNDGAGNFTNVTAVRIPAGAVEGTGIALHAELVDLDDDGDLDAIVARREDPDGGGATSSYRNDGSGTFTNLQNDLGHASRLAVGDFDGDDDPDLFLGSDFFYYRNRLYRNDGSGLLVLDEAAVPFHEFPVTTDVWTADVDGDGDLDVYGRTDQSPSPEGPTFFYVNDGSGQFVDEPWRLPERVADEPFFHDLDEDGDQDLVTVDGVWINRNGGHFALERGRARPFREESGFSFLSGAYGDLDRDGDLDHFAPSTVEDAVNVGLVRHLEAGRASLGKDLALTLHGPPLTPYVLYESMGSADIDLGPAGFLLVDPAKVLAVHVGSLPPYGILRRSRPVPNDPVLLGAVTYWQAFVGDPGRTTNLAKTTVDGL